VWSESPKKRQEKIFALCAFASATLQQNCANTQKNKKDAIQVHLFSIVLFANSISLKKSQPYRSTDSQLSCQNTNNGDHTLISCTQFLRNILIGFLKFREMTL
jgi:hypothetical protein